MLLLTVFTAAVQIPSQSLTLLSTFPRSKMNSNSNHGVLKLTSEKAAAPVCEVPVSIITGVPGRYCNLSWRIDWQVVLTSEFKLNDIINPSGKDDVVDELLRLAPSDIHWHVLKKSGRDSLAVRLNTVAEYLKSNPAGGSKHFVLYVTNDYEPIIEVNLDFSFLF